MTDFNRHWQMIKVKGDRKVRTWSHHRSGLSADIYLRGTKFVALFLEQMFEAPDVKMIERKMSEYAEHWITMTWYPVIEIEIDETSHNYRDEPDKASISFGCDRYYLSTSPTGEIFKVGWDVDEEHRKASMDTYEGSYYSRGSSGVYRQIKLSGLPLKAPMKKGDNCWLMDYNQQLWDGFMGVNEGIEQLKRKLRKLVGTRQGLEQLLQHGDGATLLLENK